MLDVILPWFPIMLTAAVGARLVDRSRAPWLGMACAAYFVVLVQMSTGAPAWADAATGAALLAGGAAIVGVAEWSGRGENRRRDEGTTGPRDEGDRRARRGQGGSDWVLPGVIDAFERFDEWVEEHRYSPDAWAAFDEFLRALLFKHCGATHVRCYRVPSEGDVMVPLHAMGPGELGSQGPESGHGVETRAHPRLTRAGVMEHVARTGCSYYAHSVVEGGFDCPTAEAMGYSAMAGNGCVTRHSPVENRCHTVVQPQWCFSIRQGPRMIGIVAVGRLENAKTNVESRKLKVESAGVPPFGPSTFAFQRLQDGRLTRSTMRMWELLITQFWVTLNEVCRGRSAVSTDAVSQLMTRRAFLDEASAATTAARHVGEPVAVCVLAIEGMRGLLDAGRWDLANDLVYEISRAARDRVRPDDLLGVFDDGRLLVLLRRTDSDLAALIATTLTEHLAQLPIVRAVSDAGVTIRCGVAHGSPGGPAAGGSHAESETGGERATPSACRSASAVKLVARAVRLCREARQRDLAVLTDRLDESECADVMAAAETANREWRIQNNE